MINWRFQRESMVLVVRCAEAEGDAPSKPIVGCCVVLLKVLGAMLPPPLPSRQPARLYIGNLAVRPEWRRCGFGRALLQSIDKLGMIASQN
jgi:ribosomal protein S18 acetylase RimI-like enzyme